MGGTKSKMDCTDLSFSIIVPAFNEEESIVDVIDRIKESWRSCGYPYEIIIVDDGSSDKTFQLAVSQEVRVLQHTSNRGYGASLKTGIKESKYDWILITDADGTYPIDQTPLFLKFIPEYDMVVGARTGDVVKIPVLRRLPKWILNKLANYLTGVKIPDINSGLRIMKKDSVEHFMKILPDGFSFTTTITLAMLTNNMPVHFLPINYYHREGKSKIRPIRDMLNFLQLIIRTILYFEPLKVFVPVAFALFTAAFLVLFLSYMYTEKVMDITTVVLFVAGIQILAIGMIADLIDKRWKL